MRSTGLRPRSRALLTRLVVVGLCVCAPVLALAAKAGAEPTTSSTVVQGGVLAVTSTTVTETPAMPLAVTVDRPLSLLDEPVKVKIAGELGQALTGMKLVVRIKGPAAVEQVGSAVELKEIDKLVVILGSAGGVTSSVSTTASTVAADSDTDTAPTTSSTTTTTVAVTGNDAQAILEGMLAMSVELPAHRPNRPGAYQLVVEVKSGSTVVANGKTWIGKAEAREKPLDLAFVWPVSLGVHRDATGVFYDSVFEDAIGTTEGTVAPGGGSLRGIASVAGAFPSWDLTLAIEPVLLTQLRAMADGYERRDASGVQTVVPASDARAQNAEALLGAFKSAVDGGSVEIAVSPYAAADLSVLAAEKWRDGFEQIQMGKQELQQTLGLGAPLTGAYSPGLDLSSASLGFYAQASIDHVVVSSDLAAMLTEPVDAGVVSVRARDEENHRATLIFADAALSKQIVSPWDTGMLFAALAAQLAEAPRDAFVIAPDLQFALVPDAYLEEVGRVLGKLDWVKTRTLSSLLREYSPGTRPVMLKTTGGTAPGYIQGAMMDDLRAAHEAASNLAAIADATREPVEAVHRLLYTAESRWWWRDGTSPREATIGLEYARRALELARAELDKVVLADADSGLATGSEGVVELALENNADYPVKIRLDFVGLGLTLPGGESLELELPPGKTVLPIDVVAADGEHQLDVKLVAGETTLDEIRHSVRFITLKTILPGIIVGGLLLLVGLYFLARRLLKNRRFTWPKRARLDRSHGSSEPPREGQAG